MGRGAHASFSPTRPAEHAATGEQSPGHLGAKMLAFLQSGLCLCERSAVSGFFRLCEKARARHGGSRFIMVLCLLIYRLAEFRLRSRLAETQQTIPDQVQKPTVRPTMRWVFQCFEGIELLHVQTAATSLVLVLRLQPVHRLILTFLGPLYEKIYHPSG